MTPRVWWILSVPDRSCGLIFSQLLFCVVGLSSVGSTKPCWAGISYIDNLYSTIWLKRGFYQNSILFALAVFLNSLECNMHVCFGSWKLGDLLDWKLQTHTQYKEMWKYERDNPLYQNCALVVIERAGSNHTVEWKCFPFPSLYLFLCLSLQFHPQLCRVWLMAAIH